MVPAFAADGWPAAVEAALAKAKDNRPELERALRDAPPDQRPGMEFLVANMPDKNLKVGYSTERRAANQSPSESRESGKASCTGLSILLSDACRSVGIPARLV